MHHLSTFFLATRPGARRASVLSASALLLVACSAPDGDSKQPLGQQAQGQQASATDMASRAEQVKLPLAAMAALDSGNMAMRADDLSRALTQYEAAAKLAPDHVAPWFGIYMVARDMQNTSLADSAMRRVRALRKDTSVLGAHKEISDVAIPDQHGSSMLPPGHPSGAAPSSPAPSATAPKPPAHP